MKSKNNKIDLSNLNHHIPPVQQKKKSLKFLPSKTIGGNIISGSTIDVFKKAFEKKDR